MNERPTTGWRKGIEREQRKLATGTLDADCACMAELFPESLITATDSVLDAFEADISALQDASDERIFDAVQRVVLALNAVNDEHDGAAYETDEREQLCHYIDEALAEQGVNVLALTARHGLGHYELTDRWRDW
ncbi:hypothetical protein OG758_09815 [Streptomyces sp. NBC_01474]|uniref:hypothetical protein n=1 Tax=unclassified Streptomyces TaxID=2593676 RepID=UPI002DDB8CB5|nr:MULTISPECIES: hypothetical protein [unclassified Streptomyces]WSD94431.1 hypothetical protein OG758_09815 [Streptomyces sp. NBC_01474]